MNQVNIKPAASSLSHQKYSPISISSLDFGEAPSLRNIECLKRDEWQSIKSKGFLRLAPTDFPAYGRVMLKSAAFFVPYYQLIKNADSFFNDQASYKGNLNIMPYLSAHDINNIFAYSSHQLATQVSPGPVSSISSLPDDPDTFDFTAISDGGSDTTYWCAYKLTYKGKRYYKLLKSLGYEFRTYGSNTTFSVCAQTGNLTPNALYLLAYLKIYCDYFLNIHEYNNSTIVAFLEAIHEGATMYSYQGQTWYTTGHITYDCLWYLLDNILIPHMTNMYTDAWNSLNSPTGVVQEGSSNPDGPISYVLPDTVTGSTSGTTIEGTVLQNEPKGLFLTQKRNSSGSTNYVMEAITQYGINTLHSFYQYIKRNNLAGSESAKQALLRFGIKGNDYESYFCRKLYEGSTDIDFSAVMSNSNTDAQGGSVLGAYAGVGLGSLDVSFNYKCTDIGVIMHLAWIQEYPLWLHGFDPAVLRKHPFDWYTPEFDGKASRAIPFGEMSMGFRPSKSAYQFLDTGVWGFTDLYKEYRQMRDVVLGDFVFGHAKNFLFARDLSKRRIDNPIRLYPQIKQIQYYDRYGQATDLTDPFQYSTANGDRFYLQMTYDISANRPILSDGDSLDLNGEGDMTVSTSGNPNA